MLELALAPFLIGLFSTVHCLGMCGGIIGMLTAGTPAALRRQGRGRLLYLMLYNGGRLTSYVLLGALLGLLGQQTFSRLSPEFGHALLQALAGGLLIGIGLFLAGWFPGMARLERLGGPIWQRLEPLAQRILPVDRPSKAVAFGMIWGWFPCGMVYTIAMFSATGGTPLHGAVYMLAFGLGTLPATLGAGLVSVRLAQAAQRLRTRRVIGVVVALMGAYTLLLALRGGGLPPIPWHLVPGGVEP